MVYCVPYGVLLRTVKYWRPSTGGWRVSGTYVSSVLEVAGWNSVDRIP
jgi:hypothetical protein